MAWSAMWLIGRIPVFTDVLNADGTRWIGEARFRKNRNVRSASRVSGGPCPPYGLREGGVGRAPSAVAGCPPQGFRRTVSALRPARRRGRAGTVRHGGMPGARCFGGPCPPYGLRGGGVGRASSAMAGCLAQGVSADRVRPTTCAEEGVGRASSAMAGCLAQGVSADRVRPTTCAEEGVGRASSAVAGCLAQGVSADRVRPTACAEEGVGRASSAVPQVIAAVASPRSSMCSCHQRAWAA